MKNICVIGSLNMDLVVNVDTMPKLGETILGKNFKEVPGGKGANQAVAIARLEGNVSMIGKVGNDNFGESLINSLKNNNVNTNYINKSDSATGIAFITVDKNAQNSIVVAPGANFQLTKDDIDKNIDCIENSDIVVIQLEIPLETVKYALEVSKKLNKFTILNPAPAIKLDDEIIRNVDLLIPNESELEILSEIKIENQYDLHKAAQKIIEKGVKELIVTLGSKGCFYVNEQKSLFKQAYTVKAVDSTAAGDSFTGAIAVSLANNNSMEDAIDFASKVGALSVMKEGTQSSLPTLKDVKNFMN